MQRQLQTFADACREDISNWMDTALPARRGSTSVWRAELVKVVVRQAVLKKAVWRKIMQSSEIVLKNKFPQSAHNITTTIKQYLLRSPVEAFLKAKAYKWLQYLETHPPNNCNWYPRLAVEVAHKVFRLRGKLATFRRYLNHPARIKTLECIRIFVTGQF